MKTALTVITAIIMPGGFIVLAIAIVAVMMARKRMKPVEAAADRRLAFARYDFRAALVSPRLKASTFSISQPHASCSRGPAVFVIAIMRYLSSASIFSGGSIESRVESTASSSTAACARL